MIGGDGIGPEVTAEALKVVGAAGVALDTTDYDLGADHYIRTGEVLPDSVLEELRGQDAILLGAIGAPVGSTEVPPGTLERGMLLRLRFALDLYINLRPFTGVPGALAPDCDFVVIRENTEGTYAGEGGFLRKGTPFEVATQGSVNTRHGVERCARFAFALAATRPRAAPDAGPQDQRADLRRRPVAAHGRRGGARLPGRHPRLQPRRRHLHLPGGGPGPLRRDRHRQPVRRHHHRPGRRGGRRHRLRRLGQPQPRPDRPVDVRAGTRGGQRHRRHRQGQPGRRHPLGRPHARLPRRDRRPPPKVDAGGHRTSSTPHPDPTLSTAEIGDAIAERL